MDLPPLLLLPSLFVSVSIDGEDDNSSSVLDDRSHKNDAAGCCSWKAIAAGPMAAAASIGAMMIGCFITSLLFVIAKAVVCLWPACGALSTCLEASSSREERGVSQEGTEKREARALHYLHSSCLSTLFSMPTLLLLLHSLSRAFSMSTTAPSNVEPPHYYFS